MRPRAFNGDSGKPRLDDHIPQRHTEVAPQRHEDVVVERHVEIVKQNDTAMVDHQSQWAITASR